MKAPLALCALLLATPARALSLDEILAQAGQAAQGSVPAPYAQAPERWRWDEPADRAAFEALRSNRCHDAGTACLDGDRHGLRIDGIAFGSLQ